MTKTRDRIKRFVRVPAKDLRPNPKNWRTHPDSQRQALKGILAEVGIVDAVIARETPDGLELVDGHLRADVLPDQKIPTIVVDLDDEEVEKVLLTFDPLSAMAGQDDQLLQELLSRNSSDDGALQDLLDDLKRGIKVETEELEDVEPKLDQAEQLQKKWGTKRGQIWVIEGQQTHRLMCGDATSVEDVEACLDGSKPFIMVTDPPYGVEYDPGWRNEAAKAGHIAFAASREGIVDNDGRVDWSEAYLLFTGDVAYVWHGGKFSDVIKANLEATSFQVRSQIIWIKPAFAISRGDYHRQHEPCWYAVRKGRKSKWCGDRSQSTVWSISNRLGDDEGKTNHGTQKPLEVMARPIRNHGGKSDIVYDPFLGSGTTMLAAEQLNRRCFGMEISPAYCAVILQRMTDAGCKCRKVAKKKRAVAGR